MVRAAVSCLSEACHTGTTLWASTCTQARPASHRAPATAEVHARGTRNGDMSHTTVPTSERLQSPRTISAWEPYSQSRRSKGTLSSLSSVSTSRRPRSMKSNCRIVESRNLGTRQKATCRVPPTALARSLACSSAQLSCTRWSRDIQYKTAFPFAVSLMAGTSGVSRRQRRLSTTPPGTSDSAPRCSASLPAFAGAAAAFRFGAMAAARPAARSETHTEAAAAADRQRAAPAGNRTR
mmetsp:Transcript_85498/g.242400  ORF Transcript_85498/g.242400 Transcript_85498/m.242400 type:complete len:237 (-) Transcript_85498:53-763(-)